MNKAIKKIVAFGVGASMLLGTAASAVLAADLSAYPSPFVQNGVFSGKIVIGEKAASIDTVGALDIAASLQRASTTVVSSAGAATQVEGSLRLDTSSDRIYYGQSFSIDSATADDLTMLADGTFEDEEGTSFDYTQSIVFAKTQNLGFDHHNGESDEDSFLAFPITTSAATPLYTSKVTFTKALNANSSNVIGNKIVLFGNEYTFSGDTEAGKLVLYGSSEEISIGMGEEVTKTVSGKEYKIKVIGFSSTKVTVQVNGETYSLAEEATKTFGGASGLRIYAKSVDSWDGGNAGTTGFATLQLGAEKVVLENNQPVALGTSETEIDGTLVTLGGSVTALTSISIAVAGDDSDTDFVKAGGSFVDPVYKTFKIVYSGNTAEFKDASKDMFQVAESGSTKVNVKIPTTAGAKTLTLYGNSLMWDTTKKILPFEGAIAAEDDYTYIAPADQKYTHFVKVKNIKAGNTDGYVEYEDVLTGQEFKSLEGEFNSTGDSLSLTVDGIQYYAYMNDTTHVAVFRNDAKWVIFPEVELKNGETFFFTGNITLAGQLPFANPVTSTTTVVFPGGQNGVETANGAAANNTRGELAYTFIGPIANLTNAAANISGYSTVHIKQPKDYDSNYRLVSLATTYEASGNPGLAAPAFTGTSASNTMADDDVTAYVNYFGSYVERNVPTGDDSDEVTVYVPADQVYANVFLAPLAASISTSSSSGAVSLNPISLGLAILDSEATLGSKPYIVVGGPCANTVAAALMGNGADCAAGFTEGKAMIKLFTEKNALLVAGYSGKDTQAACRVLASYKDPKYALSGTEMEVVTTNLQEPTVKRVSS